MTQEEIEKAWRLMSMHNSELLLENAELRRQLANQSMRRIFLNRIIGLFRRNK